MAVFDSNKVEIKEGDIVTNREFEGVIFKVLGVRHGGSLRVKAKGGYPGYITSGNSYNLTPSMCTVIDSDWSEPATGPAWGSQEGVRPIKGYEGLYSVTEDGDVISHGGKSNHCADISLAGSYDKDGYRKVILHKDGIKRTFRVCRLVASAFIPNPDNKPFVNHIDENKTNDCMGNLEWVTPYENYKHSEEASAKPERPVIKLSLDGEYICEYKSLMAASRDTGAAQGNITNCLNGRCKSVGGFRWLEK